MALPSKRRRAPPQLLYPSAAIGTGCGHPPAASACARSISRQQPFAEALHLWDHSPLGRDRPANRPSRESIRDPGTAAPRRPAATSPFHRSGVSRAKPCPAIAAWPSSAWLSSRTPGRRNTPSSAGTPLSLNHCCHQSSFGLMRCWCGTSRGSSLRPSLRLDLANAERARHRREARLEQLVVLEPFPIAAAGADGDVGIARSKIDQLHCSWSFARRAPG